jgi:hypothetical protein
MAWSMKWINPNDRRREIVRCEFCGQDVSTPYKGVHQEMEMINGFVSDCRNNGRLNSDIAYPELAKKALWFNKIKPPQDDIKWFIEHPDTHKWWSGYRWTSDPLEAFGCDLERTADRYAQFQRIEKYIITEHKFL